MLQARFLILCAFLTACASSPRYDSQGNGTRLGDRFERWAIQTVNGEHE